MFEPTSRIRARLDRAVVAWLTTVNPTGQPQSSPVWFLFQEGQLVVYSRPDVPRMRNLAANPLVAFNLDGDGEGGEIVTIEGRARVEPGPPSTAVPAYQAKYRRLISANGWTPESFALDYARRIVIEPMRLRSF